MNNLLALQNSLIHEKEETLFSIFCIFFSMLKNVSAFSYNNINKQSRPNNHLIKQTYCDVDGETQTGKISLTYLRIHLAK